MNETERDRYQRHLTLPAIGEPGQRRLSAARVLIVGLGGLGSPAALYLAGAGIGELVLADFDVVERSNLQRQIAHADARIGELKTVSARAACLALNPDISIKTVDWALDDDDLARLVPDCTVVLDCTDNFPSRFATNAACVRARVPLVTGAAIRFDGQVTIVDPNVADSPCYRCLYQSEAESADSCAMEGILGPVVGLIGCIQAIETIKLVVGVGQSLAGRLLLFDGLAMEWNELRLARRPDCPVCAARSNGERLV